MPSSCDTYDIVEDKSIVTPLCGYFLHAELARGEYEFHPLDKCGKPSSKGKGRGKGKGKGK